MTTRNPDKDPVSRSSGTIESGLRLLHEARRRVDCQFDDTMDMQVRRQEYAAASRLLRSALPLLKNDPDALRDCTQICEKIRDWTTAQQAFHLLNALEPESDHQASIAAALYNQRRFHEALDHFEHYARRKPDAVPAWLNICACLLSLGRLEEAVARLRHWVILKPNDQRVHQALGFMLMHLHEHEETEQVILHMLKTFPENPPLRSLAGKHYLRCGDYARGFDYYRSRWIREPALQPTLNIPCMVWDGQRFDGTLLIAAEKALGEEVLASSMFGDLVTLKQRAVIECDPRLLAVFRRSFPTLEFVPRGTGLLASFVAAGDPSGYRKVDAGDLGFFFRRDGRFPERKGWLTPDPDRVAAIRARYRKHFGNKLLLGVAWKSTRSAEHVNLSKSLGLRAFVPLFGHPEAVGVCLQHGEIAGDLAQFKAEFKFDLHVDDNINPNMDIETLLAQVAALDLVVSCSNSIVHLAGALGIPCWLVLRKKQFLVWYWGYTGHRCAFYPSVEIFRADRDLGDRDGIDRIFSQLRGRLDILCEERSNSAFAPEKIGAQGPDILRRARQLLVEHRPEQSSALLRERWPQLGHDTEALLTAAALCRNLQDWETAENILRRIVSLRPVEGFEAGLAYTQFCQRKFREALSWYERHGQTHPDDIVARMNGSLCLVRLGRHEEAVQQLQQARGIGANESLFEILCQVLIQLGEREAVEEAIGSALRLFPQSATLQAIAGKHYLRCGDYARGFSCNRGRWLGNPKSQPTLALHCPAWDGRPFAGTLLVAAEQGLGDEILTASMFDDLITLKQRAVIECDPRLLAVFRRSFPALEFVPRGTGLLASFVATGDPSTFRKIDAGDLGYHFRRDGKFPVRPIWLTPDPDRVASIRARYRKQFGNRLLVGIGWKSFRPKIDEDYEKNIDLVSLSPILIRDDVAGINLQYGDVESDIARLKRQTGTDLYCDPEIDASNDIDGQAAQMAALDVVISTSNSAVHLAGALGSPCWLLLRKRQPLMWYWGYPGVPCPWYSSIDVLRIPHPTGEAEQISQIMDELNRKLDFLRKRRDQTHS